MEDYLNQGFLFSVFEVFDTLSQDLDVFSDARVIVVVDLLLQTPGKYRAQFVQKVCVALVKKEQVVVCGIDHTCRALAFENKGYLTNYGPFVKSFLMSELVVIAFDKNIESSMLQDVKAITFVTGAKKDGLSHLFLQSD